MQQILAVGSLHGFANTTDSQRYCFTGVWNEREARFAHCFLPVISFVPAVVAVFLLLAQALFLSLGNRPKWSYPIVYEPIQRLAEGETKPPRRSRFAIVLALVATVGLSLQLPEIVRRRCAAESVFPVVSWFAVLGMLLVHRPRTVPFSVLVMFILQGTSDAISMIDSRLISHGGNTQRLMAASLSTEVIGIIIILAMPLRDPENPAVGASAPMTPPTSNLRSPEDNLALWQFMTVSWMTPLIGVGYKRQLQDEDVWQLGYEFQHQRLHENFRLLKGTVIQRLIKANAIDLVILTLLGLLELVLQYSGPLLLQRLLSSMEDITASRSSALRYAALAWMVRSVAAQSGVLSLWYGRRCYERSRGEMITMLYEKTLNRKVGFAMPDEDLRDSFESPANDHTNGCTNGHTNGHAPQSNTKPPTKGRKVWSKFASMFKRKQSESFVKEPASKGKILNLMRNDVYEVAQRFWEFQALLQKPLSVVFSTTLVVRLLGWPSLLSLFVVVFAQCLNVLFARIMVHYEKKRRTVTDKKLQVISQWIEAIRHLRWYGWQDKWLARIMDQRQKELNLRIVTSIWNLVITLCNSLALDLTPVAAFFAYTKISGQALRIDVAFPAMQLFQMLTSSLKDLPNLIIVIINAWVAVGRIEGYMAEPDRGDQQFEAVEMDGVVIEHGQFGWPGSKVATLYANLSFPMGLTVVCGEVGAGKTALLLAILGEMELLDGAVERRSHNIAYCQQTPWLESKSIRENILFHQPWDAERYASFVDVCALDTDFKQFSNVDSSMIGENGIGLSGGQRARVALARSIYSRAKIMLLDDPLAALDQQTAEHVIDQLFRHPDLVNNRTIILVTHRTDLVFRHADQVVRIYDGKTKVLDESEYAEDAEDYDPKNTDLASTSTNGHLTWKDGEMKRNPDNNLATGEGGIETPDLDDTPQLSDDEAPLLSETLVAPEKFIEDEHRAQGGVKASVYWEYIKAGKLLFWGILIPLLALYRLLAVGETWFVKSWGEAYDHKSSSTIMEITSDVIIAKTPFFDNLPPPDVDITPWLWGFFFIAIALSVVLVLSQAMMIVIVYTAGKNMFRAIMASVAGATFRFYDVTPVGRLMNRMTSDIAVIDGNISQQFQTVTWLLISWISSIIVIGSVTPLFLAFAVAFTTAFVVIFLRFIPTSQSLRRLEMMSLTPLMSNFGTLLDGLITVRAFKVQHQFQDQVVRVVDTFQKMDHFYWSLQAWLMYRYDLLSALSTFLLTALALITKLSPGLTAFVLIAANKLVNATHGLCKQYGQLQMEFVSVERIVELLNLEQEPKGPVKPPAWWPRRSANIEFNDVVVRYAPHMKPALNHLTMTVPGEANTILTGRTGSGKSTIALTLLGAVLSESGQITIDDLSIETIDKRILRSKITFLAQDPVLFAGSIRDNIDPLEEYDDSQCEKALDTTCGNQNFSLTTKIEAGGLNLSQGQRQLIGLSRALLRKSPLIIMDEATASIDHETAMTIQRVIRTQLRDSTVLMISHRKGMWQYADHSLKISKGRLEKAGTVRHVVESDMADE